MYLREVSPWKCGNVLDSMVIDNFMNGQLLEVICYCLELW